MIRNSDIHRLRGLFAKRLIATMDMLKKTVGTVADLTVFRKLRELDYCTSYSHRGRFYTLRELAEFDENGLWWIRSVGFSSRGTLVATAEGLVNASEAGYAVEELDAIVRVGTKDVLPKLAWEKRLRRTRIRNRNVYFSPKRSIREQQIASRRVWEAQPSVSKSIAAQDVLPDELKAAIILFFSLLDERERRVYAGLESLKLGYGGDRQMAEILGLDVSTVARGRRELLEHDVNVERVRKAGAGRKAVEKKRQKSSRRRNMSTTLGHSRAAFSENLDYGGETREVGAIDVNIDQDLVAREAEKGGTPGMDAAARGACAASWSGRFFQRRVDPGLLEAKRAVARRSANEAFGMSLLSFEKDLAPSGGELFGSTIVNVGRCHKADSRVPVVKIVVGEETAAE